MSRYGALAEGVQAQPTPRLERLMARGGVDTSPADVVSPAVSLVDLFNFQSYFDSTLLEKAISNQPAGQTIVSKKTSQYEGYAIGLHPSSQAPVAVRPLGLGSAQTYVLKPGQVIRPIGSSPKRPTKFSGFDYGLPQGWLGGGMVHLVIFQTRDSDVLWHGNPEVIFHRARYKIQPVALVTAAGANNNAAKNWPLRFPWTQALFGSTSLPQQGKPSLAISDPTRVILVLRGFSTLAAAAKMRFVLQGSNDFGVDNAGVVGLTNPIFEDITWPSWTSVGTSGNMATQNPYLVYTGGLARLAADDAGAMFIDASGVAALAGDGGPTGYVDVVRYGRL